MGCGPLTAVWRETTCTQTLITPARCAPVARAPRLKSRHAPDMSCKLIFLICKYMYISILIKTNVL